MPHEGVWRAPDGEARRLAEGTSMRLDAAMRCRPSLGADAVDRAFEAGYLRAVLRSVLTNVPGAVAWVQETYIDPHESEQT